jgi:hypothetical protein
VETFSVLVHVGLRLQAISFGSAEKRAEEMIG